MRTHLSTLGACLAAALVAVLLVPVASAGATDGPTPDDWDCQPSAAHPYPVVVVHGTFGDRSSLLRKLRRSLENEGYCVFALDYGRRATADIRDSAAELRGFVRRVRAATGAPKVSLVGHSQGGMMPRYYLKFLGGTRYVDDLVGLAPSNHGTRLIGKLAPVFDLFCRSCVQQATGSAFLRNLNAGDETPGRVSYTQITTRYDEVVIPHTSGYLEPGPRTTNLTIQDACHRELSEHLLIPTSDTAIAWTLDALGRPGPARKGYDPGC